MSDETGFLDAIATQRAERSTRLAYADWLEEHDRSREAEFLRLQNQIAEMNARLLELGQQLPAEWLTAISHPDSKHKDLKLVSGRDVRLTAIRQHAFYAGFIEGVPTRELNRRWIEELINEEQSRTGNLPYLIDPTERLLQYDNDRPYPLGTPAMVPPIVCVGTLDSFQPARDQTQHASEIVIVWFQHDFAFPIDPGVREQIRAIDWDQHARDFSW